MTKVEKSLSQRPYVFDQGTCNTVSKVWGNTVMMDFSCGQHILPGEGWALSG